MKLIVTFLIGLSFALVATAKKDKTSQVDEANFSVEETRNFTASYGSEDSAVLKMSLAQVPDEFECPLFSNSPYKDILAALDGLQASINVFPKCGGNEKTNDLMSLSSVELRQKILDAQSQQEKGETRKLGLSAEQILSSATKLQDLISKVTGSSETDCYKSDESKKLIFSINDTFQSIAPLALDFAAKNPTLGPILAQYLPVVAGAKAVSKGISVLESALKFMPTIDIDDPETRVNVIKNTCSFMKLYNKIEYITLDRASRLKKINRDFDAKIKISREIKRTVIEAMGGMMLSTSPIDAEIIKVKERFEKYQNFLGKASDELGNGKSSEIGTCSVIKTVFAAKTSIGLLEDMVKLANLLQKQDQIAFKKTKLEEYEHEMKKPDSLKETSTCAELGQEWLMAQKEALNEVKLIISAYDGATQNTAQQSVAKIKISREDRKTAELQADKAKLNIFADLSVFEPGELERRMREMPKYLFNGPDGKITSYIYKNGPVYDLLQDYERSFKLALGRFKTSANALLGFEYQMFVMENLNKSLTSGHAIDPVLQKYAEEGTDFPHLTTRFVSVGSIEHRELCNNAKLAIKAYVETTDHLLSSEYLCKMIEPVLKEPKVSVWLRRYCQDSKGLVTNVDVKAGYKELSRPLFVEKGPKHQVEMIMHRYDELECK